MLRNVQQREIASVRHVQSQLREIGLIAFEFGDARCAHAQQSRDQHNRKQRSPFPIVNRFANGFHDRLFGEVCAKQHRTESADSVR